MSTPTIPEIYFPPPFLTGVITDSQYRKWLTRKAKYIIAQDRARKRACVQNATERQYKQSIHRAVTNAGQFDPFTGKKLQWQLVCTWNDANAKKWSETIFKTFALLPTVDHIDPYAKTLDFEICSWQINRSKNNLTPDGYVALCQEIVNYAGEQKGMDFTEKKYAAFKNGHSPVVGRSPQKYFLPQFLQDIVSEVKYRNWLARKARHLYSADTKLKRPCVQNATNSLYKALIHKAVIENGLLDPFTGQTLRWDLLGTWDDNSTKDPNQELLNMYSLLPTIDHIDPFGTTVGFEICSWLVNRCKADTTPAEFAAQCKQIVMFWAKTKIKALDQPTN